MFPTLEVKKTSNLEVVVTSSTLEAKKAFTSSDVEITSFSFTGIEFAFPISNYKHSEVTLPIYTYQHLEYQYNFQEGNTFDNWPSVEMFMHLYCLKCSFGYQVFRNNKDLNDSIITCCKSFRCSVNGTYNAWKKINQNLCCLYGNTKLNCEWYCNFIFLKTIEQISCTMLVDVHNYELKPREIAHLNARY
ncbi:16809_t:CDS:2 [Cetraspora pellucida]|uniref:16809_t:CDS:1 n=1 Tax=Cetraspora pellucida TaxID=1433469 RepID=A0ACA9LKV5_9GLOM|nr:16809_t:CDS:2 [Cetraspora pellucida]